MIKGGSVASVNVGAARTVRWRGKTITTGIFKSPTEGRIAIRGVNFVGDDQADRESHGGVTRSAYAYAMEDYAWWKGELGRELPPGQFGENLTLRDVAVNGALIGERWRVGSALLQVTAPRVPCFKLGMKMDDPAFVKRFAVALRPGAYLSVLEPGEVGSEDLVAIVSRPNHAMSIEEMVRIYLFQQERIPELVDVPELPDNWREWAQRHGA